MEGETGNHGFFCFGDVLVEDKVTDAVIYRHGADGVNRLEDMWMMPYDGGYSCFGKFIGEGSLTNAGVWLKLHSPMKHNYDMSVRMLMMEIIDFIEKFCF